MPKGQKGFQKGNRFGKKFQKGDERFKNVKPFSEKHKRKIGEYAKKRLGEKCSNWKGGRTKLIFNIRACFNYRIWKSDVFTRDNFTCQKCNKRGGNLEAHHIESLNQILAKNGIKTSKEVRDCSEIWNINNGITFCIKCHKLFHKWFGYKSDLSQLKEFLRCLF